MIGKIKNFRMNLQFKITLIISSVLTIMLSALIIFNAYQIYKISENLSTNILIDSVKIASSELRGFISTTISSLNWSSSIVQNNLNAGIREQYQFEAILRQILRDSDESITGVGLVFNDNALYTGYQQTSLYYYKNKNGEQVLNIGNADNFVDANFYTMPLQTKEMYLSDIYTSQVGDTDSIIYTLSMPLMIDDRAVAIIMFNINVDSLQNMVQSQKPFNNNSRITLYTHTGAIASIDDKNNIAKNIYEVYPASKQSRTFERASEGESFSYESKAKNMPSRLTAIEPVNIVKNINWVLSVSVSKKYIMADADFIIRMVIIVGIIITILISVLISQIIRRKITSIMLALVADLNRLAEGDVTWDVPQFLLSMHDEWGDIAKSVSTLVKKLNEVVNLVKRSSNEIDSSSSEVAQGNSDLSKRTEMQAASLEETASSMAEISQTIKISSGNSVKANDIIIDANKSVKEAGDIIASTTSSIEDVSKASGKIENITKIIERIAFQTNILALNAAVEAARAGEQGKGFAVVASEVRNLAQTTQSSVKDIRDLVVDVNDKIQKATETVYQSKVIFNEIEEKIENGSKLMSEISTIALEQQTGVDEINKAISEIDNTTQQNAALVEEASATTHALSSQAKYLVEVVDFFKTKDN